MNPWLAHLVIVPIVLPLLAAVAMLLIRDSRKRLRAVVNIAASLAGLVVALAILRHVDQTGQGTIGVYLTSNWQAPFGIVLVADRLSALMLVLTGFVSFCVALYAEAGWSRAGVYFHPLFQIQLMGLNGAFLTGDLFNLFVFFEVTLAASYGLQLHGSGWPRVRAGFHYIAVNLLASSLFLVGLAMLYGVTGTLSMADVAAKLATVPASDRGLLHAGAALLAVTFLIKSAIWPLNFWLVPAYATASAPVAALFALMSKMGIYTLLRLWTLLFSAAAGPSAHFGQPVFFYGGLATIAFGTLGLIATLRLARIAGFAVIVSSGTLLAAIGVGLAPVTSAALLYLLSATLTMSALFLLVELVERADTDGRTHRSRLSHVDVEPGEDTNLDDEEDPLVGREVPVSMAILGLAFIACAVLVAGLPPLSTFVAKFSLLQALLNAGQSGDSEAPLPHVWAIFAGILVSGLAATISFARTGIRHFWSGVEPSRRLKVLEAVPVVAFISACACLTVWAEPALRYTRNTAEGLHSPTAYIQTVLSMKSKPGPTTRAAAGREEVP